MEAANNNIEPDRITKANANAELQKLKNEFSNWLNVFNQRRGYYIAACAEFEFTLCEIMHAIIRNDEFKDLKVAQGNPQRIEQFKSLRTTN